MQKQKAILAITVATMLGAMVSTFVAGCTSNDAPTPGSTTTDSTPDVEAMIEMPSEEPAEEMPAEAPAEVPAAEEKPAEPPTLEAPANEPAQEEKPAAAPAAEEKPAEEKPAEPAAETPTAAPAAEKPADSTTENPKIVAGEWNQWGGNGLRNNTPVAKNVPMEWAPGKFDRKTGAWDKASSQNIKWVASLGSQTYGNTVVASGKVLLGTNNSNAYLKRYPSDIDLGVLVCFDEKDGKFLWQHSSEKLPTGRVHDWPMQGVCCSPLVEGNRLWFVTSRGEVRCLDTEGYYDGVDNGPVTREPARLFDLVKADDAAADKVGPAVAELDAGKLNADLRASLDKVGVALPEGVEVKVDAAAKAPLKKWTFTAKVGESEREFYVTLAGPRLSVFRITTPDDKDEADTIWTYDMMKSLGTSQHNMCSCSVTALGDILFVNTSNGVDESHLVVPAPDAPSFIAMDKNTGEVFWTDSSPKDLILHGQWSSPTVAMIDGVPQVIFGGGDGWLYSFRADKGKDGKPELLWKFDANPKTTILELGGRGTRNDIISTPVVYDNKVYFATGQDPEHGEGVGILYCLDPTKRGDISAELVQNREDPTKEVERKRIQAAVESEGDVVVPNPNTGVVWAYTEFDNNGDGEIDDFMEKFHRSISTPVIQDGLLFIPDFSGLFHCVDAKTGKCYWTYDMLAAAWGSSMIVNGHVFVGDEDGDIAVFEVKKEAHDPVAEINMVNSVYSTPIIANEVLYIANKDHIFAIQAEDAVGTGNEKTDSE